jgi:hypothetical protein
MASNLLQWNVNNGKTLKYEITGKAKQIKEINLSNNFIASLNTIYVELMKLVV